MSSQRFQANSFFQLDRSTEAKLFVDSFAYITGSGEGFEFMGKDGGKSFASFLRHQYPDLHTAYYMDPLPYALEEEYNDTTRINSSGEWLRFKKVYHSWI